MTAAMFMSVALGYVTGVLAMVVVGRRIVAAILRATSPGPDQRRFVVRMAVAGGLVALLPALLLGTVVGATFGGAYGEAISSAMGAGSAGSIPGAALGTFAVVALLMGLAITAGAYVGRYLA